MPSYSVPPTKTAPTPTLASDWNTYIRDNVIVVRANALSGMGELIETLSPSGVANIATATLPTSYTHLGFVGYDLTGSTSAKFYMQFNGDNGNNYDWIASTRSKTGGDNSAQGAATSLISMQTGSLNSTANYAMVVHGYVMSYRNTSLYKIVRGSAYGYADLITWGGVWKSTSAITAVQFGINTGTFSGTICIYGMNN